MPSPYSYPVGVDLGAYVPTTNVYDQQNIYDLDVNSQDFKEFLVKLRQSINDVANVLNIKDTGYYPDQPFACGQSWFQSFTTAPNPQPSNINMRPVMRQTYNCGPLPDGTVNPLSQIAHGIIINGTHPIRFTRIFGTANDINNYFFLPLPYVSADNTNPVEIFVDDTNINIVTRAVNMSNFSITYITLEWITEGSPTD